MKILLFPILLILACVFAALYGARHNQISYSVSPEYFHQFKFIQFQVAPMLHHRGGAALVGIAASWWMGLIIGLILIPQGMRMPTPGRFFAVTLQAFALVALIALLTGILALMTASPAPANGVMMYGHPIHNPVAFPRVGTMHHFSYLGGLLGIIGGSLFLTLRVKHARQQVMADN